MKHSEHPIASIRPRISNTATTAQRHAYNTDWSLRRPRVLAWGPRSIQGPSELYAAYSEQAIFWPFVDGDALSAATLWDFWTPTFGEGSRLEFRLSFIATHLVEVEWRPDDELEALREKSAQAAWDIEVEAMQLENGDASWSEATALGSDSRDVVATHWPTNSSGKFMFLQQQRWAKFGASGADYSFVFKEGQLLASDFAFMLHQTFDIELGAGHDDAHPVRVKLSALRQTSFTPTYQVGQNSGDQAPENLRLSLVGASCVEFPI